MSKQPKRIALLVEGESDKLVLEALFKKITSDLPEPVELKTIRVGGSPRVRNVFPELNRLKSQGFDRIFLIFDADGIDEEENARLVRALEGRLIKEGLSDTVTLVPIVPSIESWLLAGAEADPKSGGIDALRLDAALPAKLKEILGESSGHRHPHGESLTRLMDRMRIDRIRNQHQSFRIFENSIKKTLTQEAA